MPYATPAFEDFVARYPEFTDAVDPNRVDDLVATAEIEVGDTWIEVDRIPAVLALVAHWLSVEGVLTNTVGLSGGTVSGPIVSETVGPLSVRYKGYSSGGGAAGQAIDSDYGSTPYGTYYEQLRLRSFPLVMVI